jgi:hypothetical protein
LPSFIRYPSSHSDDDDDDDGPRVHSDPHAGLDEVVVVVVGLGLGVSKRVRIGTPVGLCQGKRQPG